MKRAERNLVSPNIVNPKTFINDSWKGLNLLSCPVLGSTLTWRTPSWMWTLHTWRSSNISSRSPPTAGWWSRSFWSLLSSSSSLSSSLLDEKEEQLGEELMRREVKIRQDWDWESRNHIWRMAFSLKISLTDARRLWFMQTFEFPSFTFQQEMKFFFELDPNGKKCTVPSCIESRKRLCVLTKY